MIVYVTDAHVQRLDPVVKMATVLEVCTTEEHSAIVRSVWAKERY
jgi:hypothetical protein